uniref:Glycosyl transferase family 2 n=1 Tax=Cyanothece sp. (strain PCC 7425 / ATCC 29141) TaxID=395961 RepID=B8HY40_CYAP4
MTPSPMVSVILPVKNRETLVRHALDSVFAQTYRPLDVIVVDGGSTDGTAAAAQSYEGVRVLQEESAGLPHAFNTGIRAVRADLIAFIASDDRWLPEKIAVQVAHLQQHPSTDIMITRFKYIHDSLDTLPPGTRRERLEEEPIGRILETLMVRRRVFDQIGMFDPRFALSSDTEWFTRAKHAGITLNVLDQVLLHKYVHAGNLSNNAIAIQRELLLIMRESVARQRRKSCTL